jgi:YD repeat-containing protein
MPTHSTSRRSQAAMLISFLVCCTLLFSTLVMAGSGRSLANIQGQSRRGNPEAGAPETTLPNLNEVRRRVHPRPEAPPNVPSVMRGRRKPLQPRNGRKVGDPGTMEGAIGMASEPNTRTTASANSVRKDQNAGDALNSSKPAQNAALHSAANDSDSLGLRAQSSFTVPSKKHNHARPNGSGLAPAPLNDDQYVQTFFQWALVRTPNPTEQAYWNDILRAAYAHAQSSMVMGSREMGKTLFESAEYALRARSNHDYVYDLYKTYLLRSPDSGGWSYWESVVPVIGREDVRRAFDESGEFISKVATVTPNGGASTTVTSLMTARIDTVNQSGNQILARDAEWGLTLLSLPGRAGLDLGLGLSYSSAAVWTRSGPYIYFDDDNSPLSPGFRLGFPTVQEQFFNAQTGLNAYLLITSAGSRVELRQVMGSSNIYEAADSSYLQLTDNGSSLLLRPTDGTQMTYNKIENEWRCTKIKDRNGNFITVNYNALGDLTSIIDTLGRTITFNYDSNANLSSITQIWHRDLLGGGQSTETHKWATFRWGLTSIQPNFSTGLVSGIANNQTIPVLTMAGLDDGTYYKFAYTNWNSGQVSRITHYASDSDPDYDLHERNHTAFTYVATDDSTRLTETRVAAESWTGINGMPSEVATQFGFDGGSAYWLNSPDGTVYKEFYGTNWQKRLPVLTETWFGGVKQKWTTTTWTHDNTNDPNVPYFTNPRAVDSNVHDGVVPTNVRRTHTDYTSFGLPSVIMEYQADAANVYRITVNNYNLDTAYTNRRIIGLIGNTWVFDGSWNPYSVVNYDYDAVADLQGLPNGANAVQHDYSNYGTIFLAGRGNVTSITRWDATDPYNSSKAVKHEVGYNVTGAVMFRKDPLGHQSSVSYAESFSDNNNARNTFAYPTMVKDADWNATAAPYNYATAQYNFDLGVVFRTQGPPPMNPATGLPYSSWGAQKMYYDTAGRVDTVKNEFNGGYSRYVYGPYYVQSYSSVNNAADDAYAIQTFDGAGRVVGAAGNHPGSAGTYKAQLSVYDLMGRAIKQSNPTEISESWVPAGDDSAGWLYTQQTYDWKGRPLVTTNADTTTKTASYSSCGCAGGEVITLTDEGTLVDIDPGPGINNVTKKRQQKIYADVLGRTWKTEVRNWDGTGGFGTGGTVYSATVSIFNARDQVSLERQYAGAAPADASSTNEAAACPTGTCQQTSMSYDGHGRLSSKHVPEQDANKATTWTYNPDDTVLAVIDARGASATYGYNNRHLVTAINYNTPSGITPTANVAYGYDAAGNRTSMNDGLGNKSYTYNQLSQLMSETRNFAGVGSYILSYDYNLARQLKKITDSTNMTINYGFDATGRLSGVAGSDNLVGGVTNYSSGFQYRAWGGLKQVSVGGSQTSSVAYNARLQATNFNINSGVANQNYDYYNDGRLSYVHNTTDINFDSSFSYDHAGRLTAAAAGGAARHDSGPVPMYETFQYNVWGHTTNRVSESWLNDFYDSAGYTNDRRTGWTYDANGRVATIDTRSYTYDVAGKIRSLSGQRSTPSGTYVPTSTTSDFDGDGRKVREASDASGSTITTYYLRSSVLSGEIVEELNSSGQKQVGYVYTPAGSLIARQVPGQNYVMLKQNSPTGTSQREFFKSDTASGLDTRQEFDPLGANIRLNPGPVGHGGGAGDIPSGGGGASDSRFGDLANPAAGCVRLLDGVPTPCDWINRMGNGGGLQLRVGTTRYDIQLLGDSTLWVDAWVEYFKPGRGFLGYDDNGQEIYDAGTTGITNVGYFITIPSGAAGLGTLGRAVLPQNPVPPSRVDGLRKDLQNLLKDKCGEYVTRVLSDLGRTGTEAYSTDALAIFDAVRGQEGFTFDSPGGMGLAYDTIGSGHAKIGLRLPITTSTNAVVINSEIRVLIHELFHVAPGSSSNYYSHRQMALAAHTAAQALGYKGSAPNKNNTDSQNSQYEGDRTFDFCGPNR